MEQAVRLLQDGGGEYVDEARAWVAVARELREGRSPASIGTGGSETVVMPSGYMAREEVSAARSAFGATTYGDQASGETVMLPAVAAPYDQPAPTPNDRGSVQALVRQDLVDRERVGVQRYGTPLQAFNGRDALQDAYQEGLDLVCYLRQMIAERDGSPQ